MTGTDSAPRRLYVARRGGLYEKTDSTVILLAETARVNAPHEISAKKYTPPR
jgi:hypothetical protein